MLRRPVLMFVIVFAVSLALTQFLAYLQYNILKEDSQVELVHEAAEAKDRFRSVLFNDIAAANTLAIIFKQYGVPARYDSVAHQIIENSPYAEALQITENGIVKNIYPNDRYKATIGTNVNADPVRKAEEARAIEHKNIYFAGPRRLRFGDTGILGKVPVISGGKVVAVTTVLTRLGSIKKALASPAADSARFAYQLIKINDKATSPFPLSYSRPAPGSGYVDVPVHEGDWLLRVSYGEGFVAGKFPWIISVLGLLFSVIVAWLAYRKAQEPVRLNKIIAVKTGQLAKSERYFRTLIESSADALRLLNAEGKVVYQTPSSEKITGYSLSERQKLNTNDLIHPDDLERETSLFEESLNNPGKVIYQKVRFRHKDGHYIWLEGSYRNLLHDDNVGAIVLTYADATQKTEFEKSLVESESRFRRAFEDSGIGMGLTSIEKDSAGKWLKVNRSLCEMLGYTEDELLSRTFMQITHPDDLAKDLAAQERILRGERDTYRIEKRYIHKNGSFVWINLNVSVIKDKDDKPLYLVAQVENLTEKLESQNKFRNLVENFIVGVYILQDNKLVYVNPRLIEETGYTEKEAIDMPFDRFIYPEDLGFVSGIINARADENIRAVRYEARVRRKDGTPIWYEILGGSTFYQGAPALIGTMVNITDRKAMYDELVRSEANLKSIFNTTDVLYLLLDTGYKIIALNQQMKEMYIDVAGVELKEGDNIIESMPAGKKETAKACYDRVVQTNRSEDYETTYGKDNDARHFLANVKPIHDGNQTIGICISAVDITERKKLTIDLLRHVDAIEEQNKKLRDIAWLQSHVVRAPLTRMMGLIDLLSNSEHDDTEELQMMLKYIMTSAQEIDEIVKMISDKVDFDGESIPQAL